MNTDKESRDLREKLPIPVEISLWELGRWWNGLRGDEKMDVITKLLGYVLKLNFLDGYRTYLAGTASMLGGVTLIVLYAAGDPNGSVEKGMAAIVAGLAIVGHAGKMDKQTAAIAAAKP